MTDQRCTICGARKETSVPYPLCHRHADALYRGALASYHPPKTRRTHTQGLRARPATGSKYPTERARLDAHNARRRQQRAAKEFA